MQEKKPKNSTIVVQDYYAALSKKEKSELMNYLIVNYDFRYNTIQQKLSGKSLFNARDLLVVSTVIKEQLWKS